MAKKENVKKISKKTTSRKKENVSEEIVENQELIESLEKDEKMINELTENTDVALEDSVASAIEKVVEAPVKITENIVEESEKVVEEVKKEIKTVKNKVSNSMDSMFGYTWNGQEMDY